MKKILIAATILICVTCAGCFQGYSHLIITNDGAVHVKNRLIAVPMLAQSIEAVRKNFEQNPDSEVSPVAENNMSGYEERVQYPSIENFAEKGVLSYLIHKEKCKGVQRRNNWFFNAYNFDFIYSSEKKFSPGESATFQSMLSQVSFDLVIELPYSADSHNADKAEDANKILTWNLAPVMIGGIADKHMHVQFKIWNRDKIALTALVGLLLLAATIFFHVKSRAEESESVVKDLKFKRNIFVGLFVALAVISACMLVAPVTFTDADIISVAQ